MLPLETESRLTQIVRHLGQEPPLSWRGCDAFLEILEQMRREGTVVVIKIDGQRLSQSDMEPYTVVISGGGLGEGFSQHTGSSIEEALAAAVLEYAQKAWSLPRSLP